MKKLLFLWLALAFTIAMWAANEEKYSVTTQMFLMEQKGLAKPLVLSPYKTIKNSDGTESPLKERLIVAPELVDGVQCISTFIRLTDNTDLSELEELGVIVRGKFANGLIVAYIPVDKIEDVAAIGKVTQISVASKMRSLTDKGRSYTNTDDVLQYTADAQAAGLLSAYDGSGVLMGITDGGIDFQHIAFKDKNGNYRAVGAYQVQYDEESNSYSRTEYTNSTMSGATTDNESDHGTHTSSTAGGSSVIISGSNVTVTDNHAGATYGGMAPGSDLWLAGIADLNSADLALAFQKIVEYADEHDMPVVISNSWGSSYGPRDGTSDFADVVSQYFGDEHPNHVCLFASSNDAGSATDEGENGGYYVGKVGVTGSSPLGTILRNYSHTNYPSSAYYGMMAVAWNRGNTALRCKIHVINITNGNVLTSTSEITPSYRTVSGLSDYYTGTLYVVPQTQNGKQGCFLYTDELTANNNNYALAVEFYPASGSATIDVWAGNNYGWFVGDDFAKSTGHTWTAGTDDMSVSDEATIPDVIPIGAYVSKTSWKAYNNNTYSVNSNSIGDIASFSSYATATQSPTGLQYPWITAPGAQIVSAVNHYSSSYITGNNAPYRVNTNTTSPYAAMQGTSMATPTAAGIVALWLQVAKENNISLTTNDIKTIMKETAINDAYTTTGANASHFGNGKIDALAGVVYILTHYANTLDAPVLSDATAVNSTGFTASWSAVEDADSYTLQISKKPETPTYSVLGDYDFSQGSTASGWSKSSSGLTWNTSENLTIGSNNAKGTVTSPALDFSDYTKATVVLTGTKKNGDAVNVTVGTATGQVTGFTTTSGTHYAVIDLSSISDRSSLKVSLSATGNKKQVVLTACKIYGGDASDALTAASAPRTKAVTDMGDADSDVRVIAGITGTSHAVTGLTTGNTYEFKVKAVNTETESDWSNVKEVTLEGDPVPVITASPESLTLEATQGSNAEQIFVVTGTNLNDDITLTLTDDSGFFSIAPGATITKANAETGAEVTVTYAPTTYGNHSATVTLASPDAETVTVSLNGTASLQKSDPLIQPLNEGMVTTASFLAQWSDNTPAANVESYTLQVGKKPEVETKTVYKLVTDASSLAAGDEVIVVSTSKAKAMAYKNSSGTYFDEVDVTINDNQIEDVSGVNVLTLEGSTGSWLLKQSDGNYLKSITAKSMTVGETGTATTITISDNNATISFGSSVGRILHNVNNTRFTTYTSNTSTIMLLPQLYRKTTVTLSVSAPRVKAVESGDENTREITGIEPSAYSYANSYKVDRLKSGATYNYKVKAVYIDGTESNWSNEGSVTLAEPLHVATLADLLQNGESGQDYIIDEDLTVMFVHDGTMSDRENIGYTDHSLMMLKDRDGNAIAPFRSSIGTYQANGETLTQKQIPVKGENHVMVGVDGLQTEYDQSNWLMFSFYNKNTSCALETKFRAGDVIKGGFVRGIYSGDGELRYYMDGANYVQPEIQSETVTPTFNVYTPANFLKSNLNWNGESNNRMYYWVTPKNYEVADIVWAVYDAESGAMYMPKPGQVVAGHNHNDTETTGGFYPFFYSGLTNVDGEVFDGEVSDVFTDKTAYQMRVLVCYNGDLSSPVGRRLRDNQTFEPYTESGVSEDYAALVIEVNSVASVVTGIDDLSRSLENKEVKAVRYIDVTGRVSTTPWRGINIVEVMYNDGSHSTAKQCF